MKVVRPMQRSTRVISASAPVVQQTALAQHHGAFCHRLCQKYVPTARRAAGFPMLLWRQPTHNASTPEQHYLNVYPLHITLHMPVLTQSVLSSAMRSERGLLSTASLRSRRPPVALMVLSEMWESAGDGQVRRTLLERLAVSRHPAQSAAGTARHARGVAVSALARQMYVSTRSIPGRPVAGQWRQWQTAMRFFSAMHTSSTRVFLAALVKPGSPSQQRMGQRATASVQWPLTPDQTVFMTRRMPSTGGLPLRHLARYAERPDDLAATLVDITPKTVLRFTVPREDAAALPKALRPMEFAYLTPVAASVTRPHTDTQVIQPHGEAGSVTPQTMGATSVLGVAQPPSLDMNRLTDQVYQALERKIRLERQRRGYR